MVMGRTQALDGFAVITGASAGLGAAFARRFAAEGRDLVLVARDEARHEAFATELKQRYPIEVEVLPADLSTDEGCARVADRIRSTHKPVDTLVNNAGYTLGKLFGDNSLEDEERLLNVLVRAVLRLTYAATEPMRERGRGEIINVSSVAGFVPRNSATYPAAKAWVTSFSEGVAMRMKGTRVQVTAVCPGFTHTEFHERAHLSKKVVPGFMWLDADRVVADGIADTRRGRPVSIPSRRYQALATFARVAPRPLVRRLMGR